MTGVSYMIPFVVTGGLLLALAHVAGAAPAPGAGNAGSFSALTGATEALSQADYRTVLFWAGTAAMSMLVPVLSGFIAYAMAGPVALVAGVVGGLASAALGAGYLGGLVAGLLGGGICLLLGRVRPPEVLAGLVSVVLVPLISTLVVGAVVLLLIGAPIAAAQEVLTDRLQLAEGHAAVLGLVLGLMVAVDIGGPVNKAAYTFALTALAAGNGHPMAAVMAAAMTLPLGMALATAVRPRLFTPSERAAGKAGWLLGASFITEGAIPFAAADPVRVIPSLLAGSAVTGTLSMVIGASTSASHGGIWLLGLVSSPLLYVAAIAAGMAVTTACVIAGKSRRPRS